MRYSDPSRSGIHLEKWAPQSGPDSRELHMIDGARLSVAGLSPATRPDETRRSGLSFDHKAARDTSQPWQLEMFSKSLKKQKKLELLLRQLGTLSGKRCLLVTCGDNNGALNFHFRASGGDWTWVENEPRSRASVEALLGEPVLVGSAAQIPVESETYDEVVSIDVHEHLADCSMFNRELSRVAKPGGRVIVTTPNGGRWKPVNMLKRLVGMTKESYGHQVDGYNIAQHREMLEAVGLKPTQAGSYSKFFTEILELGINWTYVKVLAKKGRGNTVAGEIAPSSAEKLGSVGWSYRVYSALFPLLKLAAGLDLMLFPCTGYAVSVVARKPARP